MELSREDREKIARKRLLSVIGKHTVAGLRTLEQKISDAGPYGQRIDPQILGDVRWALLREGKIEKIKRGGTSWFYLTEAYGPAVLERLKEQLEIHEKLQNRNLRLRIGQCFEITIYRALCTQNILSSVGGFRDLESYDDSRLYPKEDPPGFLNGKYLSNKRQKLDFVVYHPEAGWAGIEAKNIREWIHPGHNYTRALIKKSLDLDCVPILVARRFQYSLFSVLFPCGLMLHQNFNQLLPEADRALADQAKDKRLLGYHDIRVGNQPDKRLIKFITIDLPQGLPKARRRFDENKDLLEAFVNDGIDLAELTALVRQRAKKTPEKI